MAAGVCDRRASVVNNTDLFAEVMLRPTNKLAIRSDVHGLWLSNKHDFGIRAAARSSHGRWLQWETSNGTSLATLYDVSGDYKWKYFGYAVGGEVMKKIYPANANGALGYSELNYRL